MDETHAEFFAATGRVKTSPGYKKWRRENEERQRRTKERLAAEKDAAALPPVAEPATGSAQRRYDNRRKAATEERINALVGFLRGQAEPWTRAKLADRGHSHYTMTLASSRGLIVGGRRGYTAVV